MFSDIEAKRYPALARVLAQSDTRSRERALDENEDAINREIWGILQPNQAARAATLGMLLKHAGELKLFKNPVFLDAVQLERTGPLGAELQELYCHFASSDPRIDIISRLERLDLFADQTLRNRALLRCMQHFDGGPLHREIAENLIGQGADVNMVEGVLLRDSVDRRNEPAVRFLLNAGAKSDVRHHAPLALAIENEDPTLVKLLLSYGANEDEGLVAAAAAKSPSMLRVLLDAGANPNHIASSGRSVMDYAMNWVSASNGSLRQQRENGIACAALLLEHGAHPFSVGALVAKRYLKGVELQAVMTQKKENVAETIALLKMRGRSFVRSMAERLLEMTKETEETSMPRPRVVGQEAEIVSSARPRPR